MANVFINRKANSKETYSYLAEKWAIISAIFLGLGFGAALWECMILTIIFGSVFSICAITSAIKYLNNKHKQY